MGHVGRADQVDPQHAVPDVGLASSKTESRTCPTRSPPQKKRGRPARTASRISPATRRDVGIIGDVDSPALRPAPRRPARGPFFAPRAKHRRRATWAPSSTSAAAMVWPNPRAAPTTTPTLPLSSKSMVSQLRFRSAARPLILPRSAASYSHSACRARKRPRPMPRRQLPARRRRTAGAERPGRTCSRPAKAGGEKAK